MTLLLHGIKAGIVALIAIALIMLASALSAWFKPAPAPIKEYTPAPVEKVVTKIKKINVPVPTGVKVYSKPEVVKALDLPKEIADNPNKQITADADVPPYRGHTSAISVLDTSTGETVMQIKQKPLPLFSFLNEQAVGAGYGFSSEKGNMEEVHMRWTFARVGAFYLQGYGEINHGSKAGTPTEAKALLQVEWRNY